MSKIKFEWNGVSVEVEAYMVDGVTVELTGPNKAEVGRQIHEALKAYERQTGKRS